MTGLSVYLSPGYKLPANSWRHNHVTNHSPQWVTVSNCPDRHDEHRDNLPLSGLAVLLLPGGEVAVWRGEDGETRDSLQLQGLSLRDM